MTYTIKAYSNIKEIGSSTWDQCANPVITDPSCPIPFDPFVSFDFLNALEASGSVSARTGWAPYHLVLEQSGEIVGAMPMYLKNHSQGEYVFDYGWADAFERAGGKYYPKLQVSIPFTPATGRRLLIASEDSSNELENCLLSGAMQVAEQMEISSIHLTFAPEDQWKRMGELGFLQRTHQQFHWYNNNYACFDDFLLALSSKKRKNIRRERKEAAASGVAIECLTGADIKPEHWNAFYHFYIDTGSRKWGSPYLTEEFFQMVGESMPENILLVMCKKEGRYVAGAINFIGGDCLFGRNWGCVEDIPFLHFEVCYYQAIEFAISRGLQRVEAGAQGPHKLARGYLPSHTYSAHWIVNESFRDAVGHFLTEERQHIDQEISYMTERSPFKKGS